MPRSGLTTTGIPCLLGKQGRGFNTIFEDGTRRQDMGAGLCLNPLTFHYMKRHLFICLILTIGSCSILFTWQTTDWPVLDFSITGPEGGDDYISLQGDLPVGRQFSTTAGELLNLETNSGGWLGQTSSFLYAVEFLKIVVDSGYLGHAACEKYHMIKFCICKSRIFQIIFEKIYELKQSMSNTQFYYKICHSIRQLISSFLN